jgi:hypothetical protein
VQPDPEALTKFVGVRRSDRVPTLYWWSLPLGLDRVARLYADQLPGARAVVQPAAALGSAADALGSRPLAGDAALVADVAQLLRARAEGGVAPCTIAVFPPTTSDAELERRAAEVATDLERLPFTIALRPEGDGRARHRFCFRVPGKVIVALEHLALDRGFGGNPGQVEMALLQGIALRPKHAAHLQLVMSRGGATLVGRDASGRRRVTLLESGRGYVGVYDDMSLADALRERIREAWRRFPVGVVMFAGLPVFIAAFWIASWTRGRGQASSGVSVTASSAVGWPAAARSSSTKAR